MSINHPCLEICRLFNIFSQFSPAVSENILANILPLIRSMISSPERLIQFVKDFPAGSETLTLRIIKILTEKGKPSELLVEAIKDMVQSRDLSAVFLLPILGSFDKVLNIYNQFKFTFFHYTIF
jgi:symplekin